METVFKGVVGMAYPGKWHPSEANDENNNMPLVTEDCRGMRPPNAEQPTMVHFDLDPLNSKSPPCPVSIAKS